ncbi:MAG TPA: MotA/TolQ/ExbB proton channel family protein [Verrucomicrobiales bacterium]|nr:MotA/TolQ/ExbB proton channel family protein [Verrucomicrobiales bacterium]
MTGVKILEVLQSGGWTMYLLAIIAVILYSSAFDVLYFVLHGNLREKSMPKWREWIKRPGRAEGRVGEIIRYATGGRRDEKSIRHRFDEVRQTVIARVSHRLVFMRTLVAAAPLAGLLGTVIGMLTTFEGLSQGGGETMGVVAGGIKEALITTQTGLLIALPGVFIALIIGRQRDALDACISRLESMILLSLGGLDAPESTPSTPSMPERLEEAEEEGEEEEEHALQPVTA